jgi:hypothetical protein
MGIFKATYSFAGPGDPPAAEVLVARTSAALGRTVELFGYGREGRVVEVLFELDPIGFLYLSKVLADLGGSRIHPVSREPWPLVLPEFVQTRWPDLSDADRARAREDVVTRETRR